MKAKAKRLLSLALSTLMVSSTVSFAIPAAAQEGPMGEGSTDSFYSSFESDEGLAVNGQVEVTNEGESLASGLSGDMRISTGYDSWTGDSGLSVSGTAGTGNSYSYNVIYDGLDIAVGPDTKLSYVAKPSSGGYNYDFDYTSLYMALDLKFTDGTYLSDLGATDVNRYPFTPTGMGEGKVLFNDQWNYVASRIGEVAAGKTIEKILIGFDNPNGTGKSFSANIDDIRIENDPEVVYDRPSDYVYTLRGTNNQNRYHSRGLTAPSTAVPHGFNFWAPNNVSTGEGNVYQYDQAEGTMNWMRISHVASVWIGDRRCFFFMPVTNSNNSTARYSHDNETAKAHYYSVEFNKDDGNMSAGAKLELAPTMHGSITRFTFDDGVANRKVKFTNGNGGGITFNAEDNSFTAMGSSNLNAGNNGMGNLYVYGIFDTAPTSTSSTEVSFGEDVKEVNMRMATSFISYEQAKKNLEQEISAEDTLEDVKERAQTLWDEKLGTIEVEGASFEQLTTLYSNMYRLFLYPNSMGENTGTVEEPKMQYQSPYGNGVQDGDLYYNNGFWDTYRTTWAAYALLTPETNTTLLNGLVEHYEDSGWVARWLAPAGTDSMVGTSSDVVFGDAIMRGQEFKYEEAYASAIKNASVVSTNSTQGRQSTLDSAIFEGYNNRSEGLSWTLEGWINDYGIANMAKTLRDMAEPGSQEWEEYNDEYEYYINSATRYIHLFKDGWFTSSSSLSDPTRWGGDYTETNGWNMAFHAPQDGNGLANLYGGKDKLREKLDEFFATDGTFNPGSYGSTIHEMREAREVKMGQYGHSNQPSHHIPYMYLFTDQPWKTQSTVREVMERLYIGSEIGQGYPGDEDNGEMSGWYVLSCLGLYPVSMGSGEFAIGSPLFEKATIHVEGGNDIVINAENNSHDNVYVQSLKLNGEDYNKTYIKHSDLITEDGSTVTLDFVMGGEPNTSFGTAEDSAPTSITQGNEKPNPKEDLAEDVTSVDSFDQLVGEGKKIYAENIDSASSLFDNSTGSSWGSSGGSSITADTASVTFYLGSGNKQAVNMYTISSSTGSDAPVSWTLEASNDGSQWVTIDERDNQVFEWNRYTRPFATENETRYSYYRFTFDGNNGKQISEIQFLGIDQGPLYDRAELESVIATAETYEGTYYTEESFATLTQAIADGKLVLEMEDATEDDYTIAVNDINKAITNLVDNGLRGLMDAVERAEGYKPDNYTQESFQALTDALANGQAILDKGTEATKAERDNATAAINDAIAGLESNGRAELDAALTEARAISSEGYTEESFAALTAAIEAGQAVYDNPESSKQDCLDATAAIEDAIYYLESNATRAPFEKIEAESYNANFSEGEVRVGSDSSASGGQYISTGYYGDATAAFRRVDLTDTNGASGITIGYQMSYGTGSLEIRTGSPTGPVVASLELPSTGWYSWGEQTFDLDTVIPAGLTNVYVTLESSYYSMYLDYIQFVEAEDPNGPPTDKNIQDLADALAEAAEVNADYYTEESYAALTEAVEAGEAVQADPEATCGQYIIVIADLRDALSGLVENGIRGLTEAVDAAKGYNNDDNTYTDDSWQALVDALANGEAILAKEDATKEERDEAAAAINNAIDGLKVRVDAYSKIEAETFDSSISNDIVNDGPNIGGCQPGEWAGWRTIDFGDIGAESFTMYYSAENGGSGNRIVDIWIDGHDAASGGTKIGTMIVRQTGGWGNYQEASVNLDVVPTGVHDLYFCFDADYNHVVNIDWFQFTEAEPNIPTEEDWAALQAALAEAASYDASNYTDDSFAALTAAVEAGEALLDNADATQTDVQSATQAIKDAIQNLVAKQFVLSASADKDTYEPNETITLTITTTADRNRIALINERGRYVSVLSMKSSYNPEDNTKTWTVKTAVGSLGDNRQLIIATAGISGSLVASDVNVGFSIVAQPSGAKIFSVASVGMAKVNESFVIEVETTTNVEQIGIFNERGNGIGKQAVETEVNGDVKTFKITISVGSTGNRIFTVKAKDPATGSYIEEPVFTLPITITK